MENLFPIIAQNRKALQHFLAQKTKDELHKIPKGFNNNIWWNIAHIVVTEQKLVYGLSGLALNIPQELVEKYQKGTSPKGEPSDKELKTIAEMLTSLPQKTRLDYEAGKFNSFKNYMTSAKVELRTVEDAIAFNTFHEGLHLGTIMALAKAITV
ncbi:DinB family protein [Croceitalea sp. MTPC5]|uniref:DinB family protein n=1 Tax=Croceitalea sp. MTPC5 TaxID=3056565 RepID=UPI002B3BF884|nr:DinB family protein [Croceitalea sp. MTPC5]